MRVLSMIVLLALLGGSAVLHGQTRDDNWNRCKGSDPDLSIAGCTAIIQSGQENNVNLANAFYNRGITYGHKGEYDLAIQDFDQALRLNPSFAQLASTTGATPTTTRVHTTGPSRTMIRRCDLIQALRKRSKTGAAPTTTRVNTTGPSRTMTRRCGSTRALRTLSSTGA